MHEGTKKKEILIAEILMCFSKDGSWQTNPRFRWMEDMPDDVCVMENLGPDCAKG
jgi:hypothetical protein